MLTFTTPGRPVWSRGSETPQQIVECVLRHLSPDPTVIACKRLRRIGGAGAAVDGSEERGVVVGPASTFAGGGAGGSIAIDGQTLQQIVDQVVGQ